MSLLSKLFARREPPPARDHPTFGTITFKNGFWENERFELWGFRPIQLLIDAELDGPTPEQEATFIHLRDSRDRLLPGWLDAVSRKHRESDGDAEAADPKLTGLSIPSLDEADDDMVEGWSIWIGYGGEDDPSYELIVTERDDWRSIRVLDEP